MRKLWLTTVALLGIWFTFSLLRMLLNLTSTWHLVIGAVLCLGFSYGTYKAIKAAYIEWTVPRA